MSFMNGGAECSTSRNPLMQFTKHSGADRSLQHEWMGPQSQQQTSMRTHYQAMSGDDQRMLENFQQGQAAQQVFNFDAMRNEVGAIHQQQPQKSVPSWVNDFREDPEQFRTRSVSPQINGPVDADARWKSEFSQPMVVEHMAATPAMFSQRYTPQMSPMYANGRMGPMAGVGQQISQQTSASSSRIVELDDDKWEDQFKQIEQQSKGKEKEDKNAMADDTDEGRAMEEALSKEEQFENIWDRIKSQILDHADEWAQQNQDNAWDRDFDEYTTSRPDFGEYEFEENNPYLAEPDPYTIGVELMDSGSKLSIAALCFEAAVRKSPEHIEAWNRLGAAQAQNEKEDPAIRALERCIKLDPGNLSALMNLSVSYTNEGYENAAYVTLEKWLSTKYPDIVDKARSQEPKLGNEDRFELHSRVTELFIRAAQLSPDGANMDADVQVGLGVLFYGNEEYTKAIDCFNAALTVRPDDPLLWNRLGATLANSDRSEEAIDAYYKALQLRPSFVRARYNLGVSCINIGCYKEAAQHLLSALYLHKTDLPDDVVANQSTNLYETLRRVFLSMERRDLVEKVGPQMNLDEFRQEFDF